MYGRSKLNLNKMLLSNNNLKIIYLEKKIATSNKNDKLCLISQHLKSLSYAF